MRGNWTYKDGAQTRIESLGNNLHVEEMCPYTLSVCEESLE